MSASREKKNRQESGSPLLSTKGKRARDEHSESRRATVLFAVGAVALLAFVAGSLVWRSGVIQRGDAAVSVDGTSYSVEDMAYYYYNARASILNSNSDSLDTSASLRDQVRTEATEGDPESKAETWYDYAANQAASSLATVARSVKAAQAAGFDGGDEVNAQVQETMDSLSESAASNNYTVSDYIKAIFGGLVSRSGFEKNIRQASLAEAYQNHLSEPSNFTEAQLNAAYDADPNAYAMVDYEYALFYASSDAAEDADEATKAAAEEAALAQAQANAQQVLSAADMRAETEALGGSYAHTKAYSGSGDLSAWLFDDARKDGDTTVLDYYGMGYWALVFHSKEKADYRTVNVRHILVDDEAKAQELLSQFESGERTEDAFAALARENSTDTGSAENGGLYENVYMGQMVAPFEAWCFDASRQSGDTGIVQTDYGYHIMYFVGQSDYAYWQTLAAGNLSQDALNALNNGDEPVLLDGMKYIDR